MLRALIGIVMLVYAADRPFAWAVVHQGTGAVLFAGTVNDPR